MNKIIAAIMLSASLAGCASSGRVGDLPVAGDTASQLVLVRPSAIIGATNSYYVNLDGKDVFSIRSGENTEFPIAAGEHHISVKCFGGWSPTWKEDSKQFVAAKGQPNYFEISPNMKCAQIEQVAEVAGKQAVAKTKFVSPDTVSK